MAIIRHSDRIYEDGKKFWRCERFSHSTLNGRTKDEKALIRDLVKGKGLKAKGESDNA